MAINITGQATGAATQATQEATQATQEAAGSPLTTSHTRAAAGGTIQFFLVTMGVGYAIGAINDAATLYLHRSLGDNEHNLLYLVLSFGVLLLLRVLGVNVVGAPQDQTVIVDNLTHQFNIAGVAGVAPPEPTIDAPVRSVRVGDAIAAGETVRTDRTETPHASV